MSFDGPFSSAGDAYGFAALLVVGLASFLMLIRSVLLKKLTRNLTAIRMAHVLLSIIAGVLLIMHVSYQFSLPTTPGIILGYGSVGVALLVWITGTAFLERIRDSLFFHGTLSSLLVALALVHTATAGANIPFELSQVMIGGSALTLVANAVYHLRRGLIGRGS